MSDLEPDAEILLFYPADFPFEEISVIGERIERANVVVPGFFPPDAGLMSVTAITYAQTFEQLEYVLLPDRNIVSRMARVAQLGVSPPLDDTTRAAVDLMAFCQAMDILIDPGLALQELAQQHSNDVALDELRWFRCADSGEQAREWIDIAQGRTTKLSGMKCAELDPLDFAPPGRWWRNYAVALKAASLELTEIPAVERFSQLLNWMIDDFIVAGPASIYAAMALSPHASRGGLFKQLRSPDRTKALAGIKNAAWDMTYLSELASRASAGSAQRRHIFASNDQSLVGIGKLLFFDANDRAEFQFQLTALLGTWWRRRASQIAEMICSAEAKAAARPTPKAPPGVADYVEFLVLQGEEQVLTWNR